MIPRSLASLVILVALLVCPSGPAAAMTLVFEDTFDGPEIDTSVWVVHPNDGDVHIDSGWLYLQTNGTQVYFPFVYTLDDPFPAGCFIYEVRMAYLSATNFGAGNVCNDTLSCSGPYSEMDENCWVVWQGWDSHSVYDYEDLVYHNPDAYDFSAHTYTFEVGAYWCNAYMDGELLGGAYAWRKPTYIMFGHDFDVPGPPDEWTCFKVDYVRIWTFSPTGAEQTTWSRIKSQYR